MKTKNNQVPRVPGDLRTFPRKSEGLGLIEDIVQAAGSITALLVNILKRPPADAWSTYTPSEKKKFVTESLQIATTSVITGSSFSVPNSFRKLVERVELNDTWDKWKTKNPESVLMLMQAEDEVKQYEASGYKPYMQYVSPEIISRVLNPQTAKASMVSGNSLLIMLLLAVGGAVFVSKKFLFPTKPGKNLTN